MTLVGRHDDAN